MKGHFVAPVAIAIVRVQHRWILVGEPAPLDQFGGSHNPTKLFQFGTGPAGSLASHGRAQGAIGSKQVVVDKWRRLVHLAGPPHQSGLLEGGTTPFSRRYTAMYP